MNLLCFSSLNSQLFLHVLSLSGNPVTTGHMTHRNFLAVR